MKLEKFEKRQKANHKSRYGMKVSNRSIKNLPEIMAKRVTAKK